VKEYDVAPVLGRNWKVTDVAVVERKEAEETGET